MKIASTTGNFRPLANDVRLESKTYCNAGLETYVIFKE